MARTIFSLSILALWIAIAGWIMNIVKIFGSAGDPITGYFIIRCLGIFVAPMGAILGWM